MWVIALWTVLVGHVIARVLRSAVSVDPKIQSCRCRQSVVTVTTVAVKTRQTLWTAMVMDVRSIMITHRGAQVYCRGQMQKVYMLAWLAAYVVVVLAIALQAHTSKTAIAFSVPRILIRLREAHWRLSALVMLDFRVQMEGGHVLYAAQENTRQ